jgi:hypothetical protein
MLDRYSKPNALFHSVIGKIAADEDEFEDFDLGPLYKAPDKVAPIPPPQVIHVQQPVPTKEPVPVTTQPPATTQLIEQPPNPDLPSWWDKGWKPIPKFKLPEDRFPTSHWRKLEDEKPTETVPAKAVTLEPVTKPNVPSEPNIEVPETIEETLNLRPQTLSISDTKEYLETLPKTELLGEALTALTKAEEELRLNANNKKLISTILAYVIAHLMGLINHADEAFKSDKENAIAATKALIDYFQKEIAKLPKTYQERANSKIEQAIYGRKRGAIRELKSQFYGPELIFVNNRAIQIMRLLNIPIDEAEKQAQDEWSKISELINNVLPDANYNDRETLNRIGANKILGGGTFEEAKNEVEINAKAIQSGIVSSNTLSMDKSQLAKMFPNARYEAGSDWEEDIAQDMSNEEFVTGQLTELPEDIVSELAPKIVRFAELSLKFSKVKSLKTSFDNKGDIEQSQEADTALQRIFHKFENIASEIFRINPTYLKNELAYEQLQDVYIVYKNVTTIAQEDGLESLNSIPTTGAQAASEGLSTDLSAPGSKEPNDPRFGKTNPRLKRIDETEEQYVARQKHEKELADASRHRYLRNILQSGDAPGYLKRKLEYRLGQRPKESNEEYNNRIKIEDEKDRIRDPEYKKNNIELTKWNYLAATKMDKSELEKEVKKLLSSQEQRTNDIYDRINESWLPADDLKEIPDLLMKTRIENFQDAYNVLKGRSTTNPLILKALEYTIGRIPEYFEEAQEKSHDEKVSSARMTLNMVSTFSKYSMMLENAQTIF